MARNKLDVQKRQHRERSQPLNRQRLGLLEKHKDYVKRARDYHSKQDRIKKLREKATTKNPDEFYFEMISSRTKKGVHVKSRGNKALESDLVKLLKTQDFNYVKTCRAIEEKKIKKLKQKLGAMVYEGVIETDKKTEEVDQLQCEVAQLIHTDTSATSARHSKEENVEFEGGGQEVPLSKKTIFVDSIDAVRNYDIGSSRKKNRTLGACNQGKSQEDLKTTDEVQSDHKKHLRYLAGQFKSRLTRLRALQTAERELEIKRALMGKGAKFLKNGPPSSKKKGLINGRDLSWYDKLDRNELIEQDEERERQEKLNAGIKTGAKVWKWKAERKR